MADHWSICGVTVGLCGVISILIYRIYFNPKKNNKKSRSFHNGEPKVVLYQIGRGPYAPSSSPFPMKLETFLRMAEIPYENDHTAKFSSKGKTPWIEYGDHIVEDSQLAIDFLCRERNVDMNEGLSPSERATARAFQKMTEENLYWSICGEMFGKDLGPIRAVLPYKGIKLWLVTTLLRRTIHKEMWGHGIGRHSPADIWAIGKADMTALANFLADKPFFMGDKPTEVDCAIFAMVAQINWHMMGSKHEALLKESFPNLVAYCGRMRDRFWPDWEASISTGKDFIGHN